MHYIELDDKGIFRGVYPLQEEIAGTEFYDGVIIPVSWEKEPDFSSLLNTWKDITGQTEPGSPVRIYRLHGISRTAAELGTDDGSGNGYIQRL